MRLNAEQVRDAIALLRAAGREIERAGIAARDELHDDELLRRTRAASIRVVRAIQWLEDGK